MHKRTTPKVFLHAKELRRELTPLERKLWVRLRAHRMKGVHFRAHTCPGGARDMRSETTLWIFAPSANDLSSSWTEVNTWNKPSMMP